MWNRNRSRKRPNARPSAPPRKSRSTGPQWSGRVPAGRVAPVLLVLLAAVAAGCGDGAPAGDLPGAAERGDVAEVRRLLEDGAAVDGRDGRRRTALIAAAQARQTAAARVLIEAGADVDARDANGDGAYYHAALSDNPELVGLVLDRGADRVGTETFGGTPLIAASDRGYVEVVRTILTRPDIPVDHVNDLGWTALLEAVIRGDGGPDHTEIVRLLIDAGADVNIADRDGVAPLGHARLRGYASIAALLEAAGGRASGPPGTSTGSAP